MSDAPCARLSSRQLMLLVAIGDEENLQRAAAVLCMAQPAASRLLRGMERMLGLSLFERLPRGMRPTVYGEAMIRHARVALGSLMTVGSEIEAHKAGGCGEVSVGVIPGPALNLLPQAVSILARGHPSVRVQLDVESSDVLIERLAQRRLDIMVGQFFDGPDPASLSYERLAEEPACAVVRPGHALLSAPWMSLEQLARACWIAPPAGSALRRAFELMFREQGLAIPPHAVETSSLLFTIKMLQQSDFVALMPRSVARYYAAFGMVAALPVRLDSTTDEFGIITRTDRSLSPAAKGVLQAIRAAAAGIYARNAA